MVLFLTLNVFLIIQAQTNQGDIYPTQAITLPATVEQNLLSEFAVETKPVAESIEKTSALLFSKNQKVLLDLQQIKPSPHSLNQKQAEAMNEFLIQHPVAGDLAVSKYSGHNSAIGFCFGRATLAHVELLRRRIPPASIRKIFVIGEINYTHDIWKLHVATVVKKTGGGWWVLDGLFNKTLEVQDWYKQLLKVAVNKKHPKFRLYIADPVKFLPITGAYQPKDMYREEYNGFFTDLSRWLIDHPAKDKDRFFVSP